MPKLLKNLPVILIFFTVGTFGATNPNFSGTYAAQQKSSGKSIMLRVVQSDSAVEVTRISGDKPSTNRFPLDGSEGEYKTESGVRGKCKGHVKNQTLVLESLVAPPARAGSPSIRFHTIEEWQLSRDGNTLTIKTEIQSPDMPPDIMSAAIPNNPMKEKYQRTDKP